MADSSITLVGTLGAAPELRFTAGGQALCSFNMAVSHRFKSRGSDDWTDETSWHSITCWGSLAENVAASCDKGTRVVVFGRTKEDSWDDKTTGAKRSKLTVVADSCAVDLRWATAIVERTERTGGNEPFPS